MNSLFRRTVLLGLFFLAVTDSCYAGTSLHADRRVSAAKGTAGAGVPVKPPGRQTAPFGKWKLVKATVTPGFLNIPIPLLSCSATGLLQQDNSYRINAFASFFGRDYHYRGSGKASINGNRVILTIDEGITTVDGKKKTVERRGKTINGTYRMVNRVLYITGDRISKGIRYTFNLQLVNS
jgi:hypothetical protein